jgi:hypothetical protein
MNDLDPLITLTFKGERFEDHGLDLDALQELTAYQRVITETAKEIWRQNHPNRARLPKNIEDEYTLKLFTLKAGSVSAPLCRKAKPSLFVVPTELDAAVELVTEVVHSVEYGKPLPEEFPRSLLYLLSACGKSLRDDESIEQRSQNGNVAVLNKLVRDRFEQMILGEYEDEFDIIGSIVMARVDKPRIMVVTYDQEIEIPFEESDLETVLNALKHHETVKTRVVGCGRFSADGLLKRVNRVDALEVAGIDLGLDSEHPDSEPPVWELLVALSSGLSHEAQQRIPEDAARNIDSYLYQR